MADLLYRLYGTCRQARSWPGGGGVLECGPLPEVRMTGRLKMQDWKMTDESARLENDGLENDLFLRHRLGVVLELRCR